MRLTRQMLVATLWVSILALCNLTFGDATSASEAKELIARLGEKAAEINDLEGSLMLDSKKGPRTPVRIGIKFRRPISFRVEATYPDEFEFERTVWLINKEGFFGYSFPSNGEILRLSLQSRAWLNWWTPLTISLSPEKMISGMGELELVGTEVVDGVDAYVLKITPPTDSAGAGTGYSSARVWVARTNLAVVRSEWSLGNGHRVESATTSFKELAGGLQLPTTFRTVWTFRNDVVTTNYTLSTLKVNETITAEEFIIETAEGAVFNDIWWLPPQEYLRKLESDPQNASLHYNLGLAYLWEEGNFQKAIAAFKKVLELIPDCKAVGSALEQAYKRQRQWKIDNPAIPERKTNGAEKNTGDVK